MSYLLTRRTRSILTHVTRAAVRGELFQLLEPRQLLSVAPTIGNFSFSTSHSAAFDLTAAEFETESGYSDPNSLPLSSVTITALPSHGNLTLNGDAVTTTTPIAEADLGSIVYTPDMTYEGADSFSWTASDGSLSSNTAQASILVTDNFAPTEAGFAKNLVPSTVISPTTLDFDATDFTNNFADQDSGDSLQSITIASLPSDGLLKLNGNLVTVGQVVSASDTGNLTYTPTVGFHQGDSFNFTASDGVESSGNATVSLNVGTLSVAGETAAGNVTISSGNITPSTTDATNFGVNATGKNALTLSRTFTITNNSLVNTVNLTGAVGKLVTVSGGNASDFTIGQPGVSSLAPGASTTFTITFKPGGSGLRKTTVSIASNLVGETPYTFTIEGTGVNTNLETGGLLVGTTVSGHGTGAVTDDEITVTYSGTLEDGTPISTTAFNPDSDPSFQFILGNGTTLAGWDEGLAGIKVGETRVLVIPAALAFGDAGSGNVPPGATVIYTVTATAVSVPQLVVKGSGNVSIAAGDTKPIVDDGTNLGSTTSGANGTLTSTFHLTDGSGGELVFNGTPVTITGSGASSFSVTQPAVPNGGGSADFTVSFNPNGSHGFKTATINIHTNDPLHPTYSFTVEAGFYLVDLVPSIGTTHFPATAIISGSGKNFSVPVIITNNGTDAVPSNLSTDIQVWAHPTSGSDVLLQTFIENVGGISAGGSKSYNLSVVPPLGFGTGTAAYEIFTVVNASGSITETNTDNDTSATTSTSVNITQGTSDVTGNLVSTTLLPHIAIGTADSGSITIALSNLGNVPLVSSQKVTVALSLIGTTTGPTITFPTFTQSVGGLSNTPKDYSFNVTVPANLTVNNEDEYTIQAVITPVTTISTDNPDNNTLTTTAGNSTLAVNIAEPFLNIAGNLGTVKMTPTIAVAGEPVTGTVAVNVTNAGNEKLANGQQVTIELIAVNTTTSAQTELNPLTVANKYSISGLAQNKGDSFNVNANLAAGLAAGTYDIEAIVTPVQAVNESSTADNTIIDNASGNPVVYTSAAAFNNIVADDLSVSSNITKTRTAATAGSGSVSVKITNAGNVPLPQGQTVTINFIAVNGDNQITLGTMTPSLSTWKVGQNATFSMNVTTADKGFTAGNWTIEAVATANQSLVESSTLDNTTGNIAMDLT